MSAFHGPQERAPEWARGRNKGALARHRARKRVAAEMRDELTPPERRRAYPAADMAPPKTPVSKPGQKGPASGKGQGKGGRTDPGGPVSPPSPKGKP